MWIRDLNNTLVNLERIQCVSMRLTAEHPYKKLYNGSMEDGIFCVDASNFILKTSDNSRECTDFINSIESQLQMYDGSK